MKLEEISPIWDIIGETVVSKKGDISYIFKATFPEIYILSSEDYNLFNSILTKSVNMLPDGVIVQRVDFFYPEKRSVSPKTSCFVDRSNSRFWGERDVIQSETYFVFTKIAKIEKKTYYNTSLNSKAGIFEGKHFDKEELSVFKIAIDSFVDAFESAFNHPAKSVSFSQLTTFDQLYELVFERYLYLGIGEAKKNISTSFKDDLDNAEVGDDLVTILSMNSDGYPPELLSSTIDIDVEIPGISALEVSTLHRVGYKLDFPHILISVIYTQNQRDAKSALETSMKQFKSLAGSAFNNDKLQSISTFIETLTAEPNLKIVEHHFGVIIATPNWEKDLHNKRVSQASTALGNLDIRFTKNSSNSLNYFFAYCPGNANDVAQCDRGTVITQHAACFNIWENNQKSSGKGVRFLDRKFGAPVMVDLWDYPGIENRNMFVLAPSGKGKSFTINHIVSYLLHDALDMVIVDVGNSYKKHGLLHNAVYIEATELSPLVYNPFLSIPKDNKGKYSVRSVDADDPDPLTPIITILFKAWRGDRSEGMTAEEYSIFSLMLTRYYEYLSANSDIRPCYNTFHPFLLEQFKLEHGGEYRLFDIQSYALVMKMFVKDGQFEHLFNGSENPDYFGSNLVIFELGGIEGNKILFQITYTLIMQIVMDKMMRTKNKRKLYLFMDEVWKILNSSMESFIKFMFKTARKHDGGIGIITQDISDILGSGVGKAIIGNSDLKVLLQHGTDQLPSISKELVFTEHQSALANSLRITSTYREIFIKAGADIAMVYKIEVSPETAKVFTSKKSENHEIYESYALTENMELSIKNIIEKTNPNQYINPSSMI